MGSVCTSLGAPSPEAAASGPESGHRSLVSVPPGEKAVTGGRASVESVIMSLQSVANTLGIVGTRVRRLCVGKTNYKTRVLPRRLI